MEVRMSTSDETRRRWAARVCQLNAWSRELRDRAKDCDAAFEQLDSPSSGTEVAFAGTRDILSFAADQVDQTAEALTIVVELADATDPRL
jgi:hypothetical protein